MPLTSAAAHDVATWSMTHTWPVALTEIAPAVGAATSVSLLGTT